MAREMTKAQHLLAIDLLEKLGLTYLRLEPAARGRYRYHAWSEVWTAGNGSPPISKRGTIRARAAPNRK
jgi:hypothetical protein